MKLLVLPLVCLFGVSGFAQEASPPPDGGKAVDPAPAARASTAPWSVVGVWKCKHPEWTEPLTIAADGAISVHHGDQVDSGTWKLEAENDHVNLVLNWDDWDPETVTLVGPDELRGQVRLGEMVMRRDPPAAPAKPPGQDPGQAAPAPGDKISPVGEWVWHNHSAVNVINRDGTTGADHKRGTWKWTDQANRALQIDWSSGFVDKAVLSEDGKTMEITNNKNDEFTVERVPPPQI